MHAILTNLTIVVGFLADRVLFDLAGRIKEDYQRLADVLSVDKARVDEINIKHNGNEKNRAFEVLRAWNGANTDRNVYDMEIELQEGLREIGKNNLSEAIYKS